MPGDWAGRFAPAHEFIWHFNRQAAKPEKTETCKHAGEIQSKRTMRNADGSLDGFTHAGHAVQPTKIGDSVIRLTRLHGGGDNHPAAFPVQLPAVFLRAWPSGIAYEPFSGSGTTLVAAEQLSRLCYAIEISPAYVAVALERLTNLGLTPKLAKEGVK